MQTCQIAGTMTNGRYFCTRRLGHEGPCAPIPVDSYWFHHKISNPTRKHLGLGDFEIWTRVLDGITLYIVMPPDKEPPENTRGRTSLDAAIRVATLEQFD